MKKLLSLAFAAALAASMAGAASSSNKAQWTGFITDTHCGEKGANRQHTGECVDKCLKEGSKAQIRSEANGNYYNLNEFTPQLRALVGKRVTVTGTLDAAGKTITVEHARLADVAP